MCLQLFFVVALAVLGIIAPWGHPMTAELWGVLALLLGMNALVTTFANWENRGNAISWDNEGVYIRQLSQWGRLFSKFARIPYGAIESIVERGKPTPEPTLINLIEVVLRKPERVPKTHFLIDPNYFDPTSLIIFLEDVRTKVPEAAKGKNGDELNKVIQMLQRRLRVARS